MKPKCVILYRSQRVLFHKVCPRQERKLNCGGWLVPKSLARLDLSGNGIEAAYVLVAVTSKLHVVRMYMFSNGGVFVDNTQLSFVFQKKKGWTPASVLPASSCRHLPMSLWLMSSPRTSIFRSFATWLRGGRPLSSLPMRYVWHASSRFACGHAQFGFILHIGGSTEQSGV